MCSVRHSPMPSAPSARARGRRPRAVSALARTRSRRTESAWRSSRSTARTSSAVSASRPRPAPVEALLEVAHDRRRHDRHRPEEHLAGRAVDRDDVALANDTPPATAVRGGHVDVELLGTADAVLPMPRATTAACEVLPPRLVRMPAAAIMPSRSSGLVSRRTRTTSSPRAGPLHRGRRSRRPPRRRPRPVRRPCRGSAAAARPTASNCGNISCASWAPVTRASASSRVISCSSTSWVAIRNAAAAVRLPTRVCSIHSLPRSTVNSMSHRSR